MVVILYPYMDMELQVKELTKKTTILFPPDLYSHLERVAKQQRRSVGDLVREAAEIQYGKGGVAERLRAVEALACLQSSTGEPPELEEQIRKGALEK